MLIPRGLLADPAGRLPPAAEVDVLVVGSGVAGLSAALAAPVGRTVLLVTKDRLGHSATRYAQGGIAAVLDLGGSGGLMERSGSPPAGGPGSVAEHVADTLAAGAELEWALTEAVRATPSIRSVEHAFLVDLVTEGGRVTGALLRAHGRPHLVRAGAVVLASGGAGQLFADTTNPPLSTGDGWPVMAGVHPLGDLAPRAVAARMAATGARHLWPDSAWPTVPAAVGPWAEGSAAAGPGALDNPGQPFPGLGYPPVQGPHQRGVGAAARPPGARPNDVRARLRRVMTDRVGVVRSGEGLAVPTAEEAHR